MKLRSGRCLINGRRRIKYRRRRFVHGRGSIEQFGTVVETEAHRIVILAGALWASFHWDSVSQKCWEIELFWSNDLAIQNDDLSKWLPAGVNALNFSGHRPFVARDLIRALTSDLTIFHRHGLQNVRRAPVVNLGVRRGLRYRTFFSIGVQLSCSAFCMAGLVDTRIREQHRI